MRLTPYCRPYGFLCALVVCGIAHSAGAADRSSFEIKIELTRLASEQLQAKGEEIVVSATYTGEPKPTAQHHANDIGLIDLGRKEIVVGAKRHKVRLSTEGIAPDRLKWIQGPLLVNVNLRSARNSSPDNILLCDFIDAPLPKVVEEDPITMRCGLIEEDPETSLRP